MPFKLTEYLNNFWYLEIVQLKTLNLTSLQVVSVYCLVHPSRVTHLFSRNLSINPIRHSLLMSVEV